MPKKDIYHKPVRDALGKDGWTVTDDDYVIQYKGKRIYIDIVAEKLIVAEKDKQKKTSRK